MITVPELKTDHLTLQPIGPDHVDYLIQVHQASRRTTFDDVDNWQEDSEFAKYILDSLAHNATGWILSHTETTIPLGTLYMVDILFGVTCNFHPVSDVGALKDLSPVDDRGRKIRTMDEAIAEVFPWCAENWKVQRIGGAFGAHNVPALKLCERVGMRKEGVIRHGLKVRGEPVDLVIYGLLQKEVQEWPSEQQRQSSAAPR